MWHWQYSKDRHIMRGGKFGGRGVVYGTYVRIWEASTFKTRVRLHRTGSWLPSMGRQVWSNSPPGRPVMYGQTGRGGRRPVVSAASNEGIRKRDKTAVRWRSGPAHMRRNSRQAHMHKKQPRDTILAMCYVVSYIYLLARVGI